MNRNRVAVMLALHAFAVPSLLAMDAGPWTGGEERFWDSSAIVVINVDGVQKRADANATVTGAVLKAVSGQVRSGDRMSFTWWIPRSGTTSLDATGNSQYLVCVTKAADDTYVCTRGVAFFPKVDLLIPVSGADDPVVVHVEQVTSVLRAAHDGKAVTPILKLIESEDLHTRVALWWALEKIVPRAADGNQVACRRAARECAQNVTANSELRLVCDDFLCSSEKGYHTSGEREALLRSLAALHEEKVYGLALERLRHLEECRIADAPDRDQQIVRIIETEDAPHVLWALNTAAQTKLKSAEPSIQAFLARNRAKSSSDSNWILSAEIALNALK